MKERILNLISGETGKGTIIVAIGNFANAFFSIVFVFLVSKILSAFDFGLFSICLTTWFLIQEIFDWGLNNLIVRLAVEELKEKESEAAEFFLIGLFIRFLQGIFIFLFFLLFKNILAGFLGQPKLASLFLILAVGEIGAFLMIGLLPVFFARKKFFVYSFTYFLQGLLRLLIIYILFIQKQINLNTSVYTLVFLPYLSFIIFFLFSPKKYFLNKLNFKKLRQVVLLTFWLIPYGLFLTLANRITPYFLLKINGPISSGIYNLAYTLTSGFLLLTTSFSVAFLPKISGLKNKKKVKGYFLKALKAVGVLSFIMATSLLPGKITLDYFFGLKYPFIGITYLILTAGMIFFVLAVPGTNILWLVNKPKYFTLISLFQLLFTLFFNLLLIKRFGLIGGAIGFLLVGVYVCLSVNCLAFRELRKF